MSASFRHDEAFPVIASVISRLALGRSDFVTHEQIVTGLVGDAVGSHLLARALQHAKWETAKHAAANMVAWFSQQITIGTSPWTEYYSRKKIGGAWAYRPATAAPPPIAEDIDLAVVEGDPRFFFHLRKERSPKLRVAKLESLLSAGVVPACEACGFATTHALPDLGAEILEVHHRSPLAAVTDQVLTTLKDLAVLCPTCHRAIHRLKPLHSVEDFRAKFYPQAAKSAG
jgi:hypothetical protein